jgi:hypothetical protein
MGHTAKQSRYNGCVRFGRIFALVTGALVAIFAGLAVAVYVTRDEDNIQVDNLLAERFTRMVGQAEDPYEGTDGVVDLRVAAPFAWDRVLIVAHGTPAATISRRIGKPWTGVSDFGGGDLLIFMDGANVARFADYRGLGRFAGLARPVAELPRKRAVFTVHSLEIRPRP